MSTRYRAGRGVLQDLGTSLDELHAVTGTPITARRPWLQAWVDSFPDYLPMAFVVEGPEGRLDAAALLAVRRVRGTHRVVAMGHGPTDAVMFPARDQQSANELAAAIVAGLEAKRGAWQAQILHLVPQDRVAPLLAARFAQAQVTRGDISPLLRVTEGSSLHSSVSSSHRRNIRRIRNKMERQGLDPYVRHVTSSEEIASLLPELERLFRARDASLGRSCALDDACEGMFFRRVIEAHASRGEVCLTTLSLGGELAAYALSFLDGGAYRMWNCRFDPHWSKYSAGKLAIDEAVQHALATGGREFDFMRGEEAYKDSYANAQMVAMDLHVWSGRIGQAWSRVVLRAHEVSGRLERSGGRSAVAVAIAKRLLPGIHTP